MTARNAASIAVGVLGVYWIGQALQLFSISVITMSNFFDADGSSELLSAATLAFAAIAFLAFVPGLVVLFGRRSIGAFLARGVDDGDGDSCDVASLQSTAIAILGIFFFVRGLALLASSAIQAKALAEYGGRIDPGSAVQMLFGLGLFFGASGIARLWQKLRGRTPGEGGGVPS